MGIGNGEWEMGNESKLFTVDGEFEARKTFKNKDGQIYEVLHKINRTNGDFIIRGSFHVSEMDNIDTTSVDAYGERAFYKRKKGDYDGAIKDYTRAIELDPKNADSYNCRGATKHDAEDYAGAVEDYTRAIELDPNLKAAYRNMSHIKLCYIDQKSALIYFENLQKIEKK